MPGKNQTIIAAAGQITARLMNEAPATLAAIDSAITRAAQMRVDLLVLPECAYPAYLLGSVASYRAGDHLTGQAYVDWLCERAERFRLHIVSGFIEDAGEGLHNAAVLIDAHGREVGRSRKRFLWNADHDWFLPGDDIRAFDSAVGRIGIVICAETRTPEILATLAADGAELIALPTCWINHARDPGQFRNPQVEYLIEARAREFGLPFICADKSGLELGAVGYVGASRIVRADGSVAAEAPPTGDAVIAARVVRQSPRRVWMTEPRRKALLDSGGRASRPPQGPQERSQAPNPTPSRHVKVAAVPAAIAKARQNGGTAEMLFGPLQRQGVQVVLANLPQESLAEHMSQLARAFDIHALGFPVSAEVFQLGPAKVGCVAGQWVRPFATARRLALEGAEILFFFDAPRDFPILRTRAVENRVFVMAVADRWAAVIGPDGEVLASTDDSKPAGAVVEIDLAQAANKLVAPKTDIFAERRVGLYRF